MAWPIPGVSISTPYGKRGAYWSCDKDGNGNGIHTGDDFACPAGTKVYAPIAGDIRHRSYGAAFGNHQFAISPDPGEPFGNGEVFFAHMRTRLADGTRVKIGQYIGEVGREGNATGPHLHAEYHPDTKNSWNCRVVANPAAVWRHGVATAKFTATVYSNKLGYGEPTNGDASSDSVKELQHLLRVPTTGRYDDPTDVAVRQWQADVCGDKPDPAGRSYLGPKQREVMFATPPYTIQDSGLPAIASAAEPEPPAPTVNDTELGQFLKAQGFAVHDINVPLGRESTWRKVEYIMVHHTASPNTNTAAADASYIRRGGKGTYPPLAQLMLDRKGEVWVCCAPRGGQPSPGRASHAGQGSGYGIPDNTMNERCLGIEVCNDGTTPIASNPDQYDTLIRLVQALQKKYTVPSTKVIGHKEWSSTGKVDPLDSMTKIRADVAAPPPVEPPIEPPIQPPEWDYLTQEEADKRYALKAHTHPTPPTPPATGGNRTTIWTDYSGKPSAPQVINDDGAWHEVSGIACKDAPISGSEHHMLYARVNFRWKPGTTDMAKVECRYVREDGDSTAYDERHYQYATKSVPFQMVHFEEGVKGVGGRWQMKVHGGVSSMELTTRYSKTHVYAVT